MNIFDHLKIIEQEDNTTEQELNKIQFENSGTGFGTHFAGHHTLPWQTGAKPFSNFAANRDTDNDGIPDYMDYYYGPGQHG